MNAKAYQLTLRIDMENSAFDDGNRGFETAQVLRRLADALEGREHSKLERKERCEGWLWDSNGNSVGDYKAAVRTYRNV